MEHEQHDEIEYYPPHVQVAREIAQLEPGSWYPFQRFAEICRADLESREVRFARLGAIELLRRWGVNVVARGAGYERLSESQRVQRQARVAQAKVRRTLQAASRDLVTIDPRHLNGEEVRRLSHQQGRVAAQLIHLSLRRPQEYVLERRPPRPPRFKLEPED